MDAELPPPVRDLVDRYLREVDGLVEQLYLVGSLALGDYQEGVSDVDSSRSPPARRPATTWKPRYGIAVRGPVAVDLGVRVDAERLRR